MADRQAQIALIVDLQLSSTSGRNNRTRHAQPRLAYSGTVHGMPFSASVDVSACCTMASSHKVDVQARLPLSPPSLRDYFTLFATPVLSVSWPYDPTWCVTVLE